MGKRSGPEEELDKLFENKIKPYKYFALGLTCFVVIAISWSLIDKKSLVVRIHNEIFHPDEEIIKSVADSTFRKESWITAYQERIVLTASIGDDGKFESVEVPFHTKKNQRVEVYLEETKNSFGNRKYQILIDDRPIAVDPSPHLFLTDVLDYERHADIHKLKFSLIRDETESDEHYRDGRLQIIYCVILVHGKPSP